MNILFYAGSLRPGGGLTVAKIMIEALAEDSANNITVYTGETDSSLALNTLISTHDNITEQPFFPKTNSEIRYALSKLYFLPKTIFKRDSLLISVNYFIPVFCKQFVYHLNLLSFMRQKNDLLPKKFKEKDASLACRFATINAFESEYLKTTAEAYTQIKIRNPKVLYIGVDPEFYIKNIKYGTKNTNPNILLVSSPQPHKDNNTCIDALSLLLKNKPDIQWKLTIAGGQSIDQWKELQSYVENKGVINNIMFLGPVNKKQLTSLLQQSLCLISASKIESFCMVALEAMASGCPAIVTNETSMPESVGDAAIVVESGNASQFAESIIKIHDSEDFRSDLIEKGKIHSEKFSNINFKKQLADMI